MDLLNVFLVKEVNNHLSFLCLENLVIVLIYIFYQKI